jgi:hypothetical protein
MIRWLIGGVIGASIGIAIWVAVRYFTNYEVGYIALGVGFLVGMGVRYGADSGGDGASIGQGLGAAALALGAVVAAKYIAFSLLVAGVNTEMLREIQNEIRIDDEAMIASLADETAKQLEDQGKKVAWPPGMTYDDASKKADYPPEIWRNAETQWKQLGEEEQQKRRQATAALSVIVSDALTATSFSSEFSPWDILWVVLATFTAFKLGVGAYGDDD